MGGVVAGRQLHQAQPVAMRPQAERLGIDGDAVGKVRPAGRSSLCSSICAFAMSFSRIGPRSLECPQAGSHWQVALGPSSGGGGHATVHCRKYNY